jgi:hypothetical protein
MKTIGWTYVAWAFVGCAHAEGLSPQDFASEYSIVLSSEASVYRIELPPAIYQGTVHDELEDLAVFNSRGEAVPFFIRSSPRDGRPGHAPAFLPLFPLLGATPSTASEMRVTIESAGVSSAGGHSPGLGLRMDSSVPAPGSAVPRQYILDARAFEDSLAALQLVWAREPVGYSGRVRIESSDDLDSWRTVVAAAPVASLQANGREFVHARIEFPAARGKFWRLTWVGGTPSSPLTKVLGEFAENRTDAAWAIETVRGRQDTRRPADFEFDLEGHIPVERIDVPLTRDRYWLARVPEGNPLFAGELSLAAAWHPSELVFLAQGNPPFVLAYGSGSLRVPRTDLTSFISGIAVAPAALGDAKNLGGVARLAAARPPVQWRRWILWLVLFGALAALASMAHRLLEENGTLRS